MNKSINLDNLGGKSLLIEFGLEEERNPFGFITNMGTFSDLKDVKLLQAGKYFRRSFDLNIETGQVEEVVQELDLNENVLMALADNFQVDKEREQFRPIDYNHDMNRGQFAESRLANKAAGWVKDLKFKDGNLVASSDFTPEAKEHIRSGEYKYASITFDPDWLDPITGEKVGPKMLSYALTNMPFMENLGPIEFSSKTKDGQSDVICFSKKLPNTGDINMDKTVVELSQKVGKAEAEIEKLKANAEKLSAQLDAKDKEIEEFSKRESSNAEIMASKEAELVELSAKYEKLKSNHDEVIQKQAELREKHIELEVEQDFANKKILPAEKEALLNLAKTNKESYDALIAARGVVVDTVPAGSDSTVSDEDGILDFEALVEKIQREEKLSYSEALDVAVQNHHGEYMAHIGRNSIAR